MESTTFRVSYAITNVGIVDCELVKSIVQPQDLVEYMALFQMITISFNMNNLPQPYLDVIQFDIDFLSHFEIHLYNREIIKRHANNNSDLFTVYMVLVC